MKVALINLHGDTNMTAAYLHSLIKGAGYSIKTIHFKRLVYEFAPPLKEELCALKRVIGKVNPSVVLMSVNSMSFWNAVAITKALSDRTVIWGGVQPLIDPERCLEHAGIIVRGEGEGAILDILNALEKGKPLGNIKNVWLKNGKKTIRNDFRPLISNLDNLPIPDFTDEDKLYILGKRVYAQNPLPHSKYEYNIAFSRGCPFSCKYCINHVYNREFKHKYLRRKGLDSVMKELVSARRKFPHLAHINFWDDVFITDAEWLRRFAPAYKKHVNLPFFAYGNARFVNEENIRLLKQAGLDFFDIGIQSGSEDIRKRVFGRLDSNEDILRADRILHKLRIKKGYDIIFSEFETEKDMMEGIMFLLKLKKPFKVQRNKLAYYPHFEITEKALAQNKISINDVASMNPSINSQMLNKKEAFKFPLMTYYYFIGKRFIPNSFVKYMLLKRWHIKHPKFMARAGGMIERFENFGYSIKSLFGMMSKGEFRYLYNRIFNKKEYFPMG